MQFPLSDRGRWACLGAAVLVAVLAVAWSWPASRHDAVMLTPAAMRAMGQPAPVVVTSTPQPAATIEPPVVEAARTAAVSAPAVLPPTPIAPAAPPVEPPVFKEGEAPWDLAPPFRH